MVPQRVEVTLDFDDGVPREASVELGKNATRVTR
jgi:hypothetical protein